MVEWTDLTQQVKEFLFMNTIYGRRNASARSGLGVLGYTMDIRPQLLEEYSQILMRLK